MFGALFGALVFRSIVWQTHRQIAMRALRLFEVVVDTIEDLGQDLETKRYARVLIGFL